MVLGRKCVQFLQYLVGGGFVGLKDIVAVGLQDVFNCVGVHSKEQISPELFLPLLEE